MEHLKRAAEGGGVVQEDERIQMVVKEMLTRIKLEGQSVVREYATQSDGWQSILFTR
jgi:sulfopropanediol 3-dehydrogenase